MKTDYADRLYKALSYLKESRRTVFFGGAGVSTGSGVMDFRSKDGIYNTVREYHVSPETILSHSFFVSDPAVFYDFNYKFFLAPKVSPCSAHTALSRMEEKERLFAVVTQNIDGLHQAAGSKNVLELHGTAHRYYCTKCHADFPAEEVHKLGGGIPYCKKCDAIVRPDIVLYEEALPEDVVGEAIRAIESADILIVGGTSLAVYPAASYLHYFRGKALILMNRDETPFDGAASVIFRENIGDVLSDLESLL